MPGISLMEFWPLPLRAKCGLALRCVRRVEQFFTFPENDPEAAQHLKAFADAKALALAFALGSDEAPDEAERIRIVTTAYATAEATHEMTQFAGYSAAHAAQIVRLAAQIPSESNNESQMEAMASAFGSYRVVLSNAMPFAKELVEMTLRQELDKAISLELGANPDRGKPLDPSDEGPLGPLWPLGVPMGYA